MAADDTPLHVFRFEVSFKRDSLDPTAGEPSQPATLCSGAFAECSGLEATMEPKLIKSGGLNYGAAQRAGPVTFATVVLKRGMTKTSDLWTWWQLVAGGKTAYRLEAEIAVKNAADETMFTWVLSRVLPVKFKAADLNAKGNEIGIEELHLAHEGLRLLSSDAGGIGISVSLGVSASVSVGF